MLGITIKEWAQAAISLLVIWAIFAAMFWAYPNLIAR